MKNSFDQFVRVLESINQNLSGVPFWKDPFFWTGMGNIFLLSINITILYITLRWLKKYTKATEKMKQEMVRQTEIEQKPILMMYIRDIKDYPDKREKLKEYCIETGAGDLARRFDQCGGSNNIANSFDNFYIALRNVGKGPAFNLRIESDHFKVEKYRSRFFAPEPKGDEHPVKIVKKSGDEIKIDELEEVVFRVYCENIEKRKYGFKYRIVDIESQQVEYLGQ